MELDFLADPNMLLGHQDALRPLCLSCRVSVSVGCSVVLLLICLAACCGCMIPSEDCFERVWACPTKARAALSCWLSWRCFWCCHKSKEWIDPHLEPPVHFDKHRPFFEVDEDGPRGDAHNHLGILDPEHAWKRWSAAWNLVPQAADAGQPFCHAQVWPRVYGAV